MQYRNGNCWIILFLLLLLAVSCSRTPEGRETGRMPSVADQVDSRTPEGHAAGRMPSVADQVAEQYVKQTFTKCGGSYYGVIPTLPGAGLPGASISETKSIFVSTKSEPLSEADKLNGYEWKGDIILQFGPRRYHNSVYGWEEWVSRGPIEVTLEKKNGRWLYPLVYPEVPFESYRPGNLDCAQIPR